MDILNYDFREVDQYIKLWFQRGKPIYFREVNPMS